MALFASDLTAHMRLFELIRQEQMVARAPDAASKPSHDPNGDASAFQRNALKSFR
ncbi:MAG: hypothetical protein AB3N09_06515 [Tateyamaria sp.]